MSRNILVGVGGGIAAYKTCEIVRGLTRSGARVRVAPTPAALRFVGAPTWEALSHAPVETDVFARVDEVLHVELGQWADLILIAPATADLLSRSAAGRADDLLTASLLASRAPVLAAPAMHTAMWENPATAANIQTLRDRGWEFLGPVSGALTGADSGMGRMFDPESIVERALATGRPQDLRGRRIVVTAGGTHEDIDPVRFIGNRSSGRQGIAVAEAARDRGAEVTLIAAHVDAPLPAGVHLVQALSAERLQRSVHEACVGADALVMVAAVCDYRPTRPGAHKLKKHDLGETTSLELTVTPDILAGLTASAERPPVVVGFAAETASGAALERLGTGKRRAKGCDLLVANDVTDGVFGTDENHALLLAADAPPLELHGHKREVADGLLDAVTALLERQSTSTQKEPLS
ncbi:MAG: bifunctional phosphopantothenoylcysteine decarboxylase/phosphopantothenate--cysteine ligase CoaBC [Microbacteriaceae bacterium]|nr:bifunctional phosphopantothenoylcysteine decarboxylase/phosphopantothenate--cysteine ligase CoaBC [Microbacteriaceae bacterium]MCI1206758.1 bifunctional phosphopantothenoylcysteine decarboxylase/phosphopantothenate--cysteine ligase CoaBC [Microbacteriaceae bacterium]